MAHIYKIELEQRDEDSYDARKKFELQLSLSDDQFARLVNNIVSIATDIPGLIEPGTDQKEA